MIRKNSINRILDLPNLLNKKSFFLFGARGSGKTSLIRNTLSDLPRYDLLDASTFSRLSRRPTILAEELGETPVVIDEIQKLPQLLDEVHRLIEERGARFLLTGSSARKLKRGGANLLAGRAWQANLFPFVSHELGDFSLERYLLRGGLPMVWLSSDPWEELKAYVGTYLREEIFAESQIRRLDAFTHFLDLIALRSGEEINFESVGSDLGVNGKTVRNFLEVLEDTLIGFFVPPYLETRKRKASSRSKFYLFDIGVTNSLLGRKELIPNSDPFGRAFEHFIALELRAYLSYRRLDTKLSFWRSDNRFEVDFVLGSELAIEVKSSELINERDLKGIKMLREEGLQKRYCVVSRDPQRREIQGITIYPWREFLAELWADGFSLA
jgi:uncharacterized protein